MLVTTLIAVSAFALGTMSLSTRAQDGTPIVWPNAPTIAAPEDTSFLNEDELMLVNLYNQVANSVVSINTLTEAVDEITGDEFFGGGTGTGFIIDTQGHIVTNNHVIDGATTIEVNFFDGRIVRAELIGADADSDLAVIQVEVPSDTLGPVVIGNSDELFVGQSTVALGSPFNEPWTMTTGIVSALNRTIRGLNDYSIPNTIQTDAAINPGNSGGPLFNMQGEVIGVNSQIRSETRSNSGVGYAIPSNLMRRVSTDLIANGRVDYSYLGIGGSDVNLAVIESLNLPNNARGVVVGDVAPNGPAGRGGLRGAVEQRNGDSFPTLQSADIITAVNGSPVTGMPSLISYLANYTRPGQEIILTVVRDGEAELTLAVTLTDRPN